MAGCTPGITALVILLSSSPRPEVVADTVPSLVQPGILDTPNALVRRGSVTVFALRITRSSVQLNTAVLARPKLVTTAATTHRPNRVSCTVHSVVRCWSGTAIALWTTLSSVLIRRAVSTAIVRLSDAFAFRVELGVANTGVAICICGTVAVAFAARVAKATKTDIPAAVIAAVPLIADAVPKLILMSVADTVNTVLSGRPSTPDAECLTWAEIVTGSGTTATTTSPNLLIQA
jgi:hypothetical protein